MKRRMKSEPHEFQTIAWANLAWFLGPAARGWRGKGLMARAYMDAEVHIPPLAPFLWMEMRRWTLAYFTTFWLAQPSRIRWELLKSAISHQTQQPTPPMLSSGRDADGWIKKDCTIRIPFHPNFAGVKICLELPAWSGLIQNHLAVSGTNMPSLEAQLRPGLHEILACFSSSQSPSLELEFRCETEFTLPNDGRHRALRVTALEYLHEMPTAESLVWRSPTLNPSGCDTECGG